jgi:anthranilate/para-aminobenzoate synthase component I
MLAFEPWLSLRADGPSIRLVTSSSTTSWNRHPLDALCQVLSAYRSPAASSPHARAIGLFGCLSYEANRWIERLPPPKAAGPVWPDLLWYGMRMTVVVDHIQHQSWLVSLLDPCADPRLAAREAERLLGETAERIAAGPAAALTPVPAQPRPSATSTRHEFQAGAQRILRHIEAGEIFQANLSQRFTAPWTGDPLALYLSLRRINPSPFATYLQSDDLAVVSCSPERLVSARDGKVETRPIAGTRPRGHTPADDAINSLQLLMSEKERAEHLMLVDLERNDLGRVAKTGTVRVDELLSIEEYSHVIHIVSNVSASLRRGVDPVDVIRAVFPGGTITGCPKVRSMQILHEVEPVPRGIYTGSVGRLGFDRSMDLNIAIRTFSVQQGRLSFHAGAGIVADSSPEREYDETMAKAAALFEALEDPVSYADP